MNSKSKKLKGNIVILKKVFSIKYQVFQFDLILIKFEEEAIKHNMVDQNG
jgi:hypothetical protein